METRTAQGIKYKRDEFFIGKSDFKDYYEKDQKIKFTDDQMLYLTQREGQTFGYSIPLGNNLPENQTYVLVLKFAELQYKENDQRIFSVFLGRRLILENVDIFKLVGANTAHTEYVEFIIDEGEVIYQGERCIGAINNKNELIVGFTSTTDSATVAGLFLFKGPLSETDYEDKEKFQESWKKRNTPKTNEEIKRNSEERIKQIEEEIQQKQNILKIRDGFAHELDIEKIEPVKKRMEWPEFSFELLFILLKTPLGAVMLVGFLTVCFVTINFVFFDPYGQRKLQEEYEKQKQQRKKTIPKAD